MSRSHSPVFGIHRTASACALALAIAAGQAGAQAPTQLAPAIRNFDREDPATVLALPKLLSQTGLYRNIGIKATRAISDTSVVAFQVNSALWSDGSHKERFISLLPGTKVVPTDTSKFAFPDGAVLIKNFLIDSVYGDNTGNSRIFIETRFLVYQSSASAKKWSGISYRWRRDQSDAELVDPEFGLDTIHNVRLNGQLVGKRWRYPSTMDCAECHKGDESSKRGTLGFITPQLNRVIGGTNQLQSLFARGILSLNPMTGKSNVHRWYALNEDTVSLEKRARSYFASNCSHCHGNNVLHGQAVHNFDYFTANKRIAYQGDPSMPNDPTGAWLGQPSMSGGSFAWLALSGYPDSSVLLDKMKRRVDDFVSGSNPEQMPPLATSQPDSAAVKLIEQWLCSLKTGGACNTIPWSPDETFWAEPVSVSLRPHGKPSDRDFHPSMREGRLSVPAHIAALGRVELRDYRGRKVPLAQEGTGVFRIPRTLTPGIYFLLAGNRRVSLNYIP
jgi:hypothetical protein